MDVSNMLPEERKAQLDGIITTHRRFVETFLLVKRHHSNYRPGKKGHCLFITGITGAGKSTPLEGYAQRFPEGRSPNGSTIRRVVIVSLPPMATLKSAAVALLAELGIIAKESWTYTHLIRLCIAQLKGQGAELIIFDEFQHCFEGHSEKKAWEAADLIKMLLDETGCQIICAGLSHAAGALSVNPQLKRRTKAIHVMRPYEWASEDDRQHWKETLADIGTKMPFEDGLALDGDELAFSLHVAGGGHIGLVMDLLKMAAEEAIDEKKALSKKRIGVAYRGWMGTADYLNPFLHGAETVLARLAEKQGADAKAKSAQGAPILGIKAPARRSPGRVATDRRSAA